MNVNMFMQTFVEKLVVYKYMYMLVCCVCIGEGVGGCTCYWVGFLSSFFFSFYTLCASVLHTCIFMKKNISGEARQALYAIPGQHCFKLISSHQQGIRTACLVHHRFIYMCACPVHLHL